MERKTPFLRAAALLLLTTPLAHAYDGTITFNGSITASTCTVVGAAQAGQAHAASATILLPTLPASSFSANSSIAGTTNFELLLTGCLATASQQNVRTLFTTPDEVVNGVIVAKGSADSAAAGNIGVILQTENGTVIDVNGGSKQDPGAPMPASTGDVKMKYQVSYSRVDSAVAVTPGKVSNTINYEIAYF